MYDLIVIGSGPGGYEAAAHAGKMGKKVAIVEKNIIGGVCLNVGCIPTKTMLKSAKVLEGIKESSLYGIETSAPTINFNKVLERKDKVVSTLQKGVEGLLKRSKVEIIKGTAKFVAKDTIKVGDNKYTASNFLIATGAVPTTPPIPGIDSKNVITSSDALSLKDIPESMVIVGGGVIGLEFASLYSEMGTKVTIIEMLPEIAGNIDADLSKRLLQVMKKSGIDFHLSAKVTKIDKDTVSFTDKDGKNGKITGTYILNATGRTPVTDGLELDTIGVVYNKKGIVVSEYGKTNISGIWACGDCTGRSMLAHSATREGIVAVNNMFGISDRMSYKAIPSVVYTHPELASVGKTEAELKEKGIEYKKSTMPMAIAGRFIVENEGKQGTVKVLVGAKYGEILGVHMMGDPSSEIIFGAATLIETEATIEELKSIVYPHPTVSEALRETIVNIK